MWYEINVSKNGSHFFATREGSITDKNKMLEVLGVFQQSFLEVDGFKMSVRLMSLTGSSVDIKECEKELSESLMIRDLGCKVLMSDGHTKRILKKDEKGFYVKHGGIKNYVNRSHHKNYYDMTGAWGHL